MNLSQEKALFHLSGKLDLSQVSAAALQKLADEAPYFAPARFFAAAKTKKQNPDTTWKPVAEQTGFYFTNLNWFELQLEEFPANTEQPAIIQDTNETEPVIEQAEITPGSKISGLLSHQLADFKKPLAEDAALDIDTEQKKLHTIDYFASQGIKIDLSAIPQDKLTTHLRKFTDWLKQVKTAQSGGARDFSSTPEMEKAVAENARISNETKEVVTEAMADVLVKQGQAEKAIQLYIKLSFINPEKSSYFAAKIEQLKGL